MVIIIESSLFLFPDSLTIEEGKELFINKIISDERFTNEVVEDRLNIIDTYYGYYNYDLRIVDYPYYIKEIRGDYSYDGKANVNVSYTDPKFILNEFNKKKRVELEDKDKINLFDENHKDEIYKTVLKQIEKKVIGIALESSNKRRKDVRLEIGLIDKFDECKVEEYYEHILVFYYKSDERKKDFISVLSLHTKEFYTLEFEHSKEYLEFYSKYKRPSVYIPQSFIDFYYQKAFISYLNMQNKLKYESSTKILRKIKDGLGYKDYTPYQEYLDLGIYYFRQNKYLNKYESNYINLKERIYLSYLTLYYNKESGIFLANCTDLDLLDNNDVNYKLKLLRISYGLKSLEAKALLFKHYSSLLFYDEYKIKKYT